MPLWAKVFAEHETLRSADSKDYSEIRGAIAEVMRSSDQPVMPLQTPHKTPQRKGSTDSVGSSSVKRSLSFTPDSAKQQPEPKAEEQQQVAEQPKPEPKAEEKQVTSAETESQTPKRLRVTGKQPPTQALPEAGSLTILGHSAEERFRITYEARQLLRKVFASPETPIVGSVGRQHPEDQN